MNELNFNSLECVATFVIGIVIGFWIASFLFLHQKNIYEKQIADYDRKYKKLLHFVKFKLKKCLISGD